MTCVRKNLRSSYVLACAMALASPILGSVVPALIAAFIVVVAAVLISRTHDWMLGCLALVLSAFGILLTINPTILVTYLG